MKTGSDVFTAYPDSLGTNEYDAYETDIARVEFYFDVPTVFQVRMEYRRLCRPMTETFSFLWCNT